MAENESPQGEPPVEGENATQEIDWKAESRKHEARSKEWAAKAKANEDAARRLAEIEETQKTEAEKQKEALAKIQKDLADERAARLRAEVAGAKGVPASLLTGSTREELEASAEELIAFKGDKKPDRLVVDGEGKKPAPKETNAERFAALIEEKLS